MRSEVADSLFWLRSSRRRWASAPRPSVMLLPGPALLPRPLPPSRPPPPRSPLGRVLQLPPRPPAGLPAIDKPSCATSGEMSERRLRSRPRMTSLTCSFVASAEQSIARCASPSWLPPRKTSLKRTESEHCARRGLRPLPLSRRLVVPPPSFTSDSLCSTSTKRAPSALLARTIGLTPCSSSSGHRLTKPLASTAPAIAAPSRRSSL